MHFIACSNDQNFAQKIAKNLNQKFSKLIVKNFPDNELYVKYPKNIRNDVIVLVQTFHKNIQSQLIEVLMAAHTAKSLKAKKVILLSSFYPYFRQDKMFNFGEAVTIDVMDDLFRNCIDKIFVVNPHLHRRKTINEAFSFPAEVIDVTKSISNYIKNKIRNPLLIGPDMESKQWVKSIADSTNSEMLVFNKKRLSPKNVKISVNNSHKINGRNVVLIDDMISTGNTLLEAIKLIKKKKPKKIYCIAIHGLFVGDSLNKLKKNSTVLTTNSIINKASKIDIIPILINTLRSYLK